MNVRNISAILLLLVFLFAPLLQAQSEVEDSTAFDVGGLKLIDRDGNTILLSKYQGKITVLYLWSYG